MTTGGSAQPIFAMQSSVRPVQDFFSCALLRPIISAHSSLIADAAMVVSGIGMAEANAASWARSPSMAPRRSRKENQRFTVELWSLIVRASICFAAARLAELFVQHPLVKLQLAGRLTIGMATGETSIYCGIVITIGFLVPKSYIDSVLWYGVKPERDIIFGLYVNVEGTQVRPTQCISSIISEFE